MLRIAYKLCLSTSLGSIRGGLAQLGERLAGSQKVRGSNPLSSTIFLCPYRGTADAGAAHDPPTAPFGGTP